MVSDQLGSCTEFDVLKITPEHSDPVQQLVATEVPCTFVVNGVEVATIMCTPTLLHEFAAGYLFTSGLIASAGELKDFHCDQKKWQLDIATAKDADLELLGKRVYTSGCGKGVMYPNIIALSSRYPLESDFSVSDELVWKCLKQLLSGSALYRDTHGVHTAAISINGQMPNVLVDDIGRHNAVDKVIGHCLLAGFDLSQSILLCTGRISSEILYKARRASIPIVVSRGASTHQSVLLAREMGVTLIGLARAGSFSIYSHHQRIIVSKSSAQSSG
jgi:FdhD protein